MSQPTSQLNASDSANSLRATPATRHSENNSKSSDFDTEISYVLLLEDDIAQPITEGQETRPTGKNFAFVKASTCIWLVLCLLVVELFVTTVKPLQYLPDKKYRPLEHDAWVAKIPSFFNSDSHPQTLIIGSSLPMFAFALFDRAYAQSLPEGKMRILCTYTDARYFEHLLKQDLGFNGSVKNLTLAGCMVSESYALLKRLVASGRAPEYVIYGIAPRDFIDNQMPPIWQSPVYEVLGDFDYLSHMGADFPRGTSLTDFALSSVSRIYRSRKHYQDILTAMVGDALGHPISLYAASRQHVGDSKINVVPNTNCSNIPEQSVQTSSNGTPTFADLEEYKHRYLPINLPRYRQEKAYFARLADLCAKNHIKLVVVKMPLTAANRALIPGNFRDDYDSFLDNSCLRAKFQIVDLCQSNIFTNCDFFDSVHLNESGSRKFQDTLIEALKSTLPSGKQQLLSAKSL